MDKVVPNPSNHIPGQPLQVLHSLLLVSSYGGAGKRYGGCEERWTGGFVHVSRFIARAVHVSGRESHYVARGVSRSAL